MGFKQIYSLVLLLSFGITSYAHVAGDHQHIDPFLTIRDFAKVKFATFSPDNKIALTVSQNEDIKLWDVATGNYIHGLFKPFTDNIRYAEFSPDGTKILFFTHENVIIWDIWRGNWLLFLGDYEHIIYSAHFSPDGNFVVSTADDNTVKVWFAHSGELLRSIYNDRRIVDAVFAADNFSIIGTDGNYPNAWVYTWDSYGHLIGSVDLNDNAWPVITEPDTFPEDGAVHPVPVLEPENTIACPGHPAEYRHDDVVRAPRGAQPISPPPPFVSPIREFEAPYFSEYGRYFGFVPFFHPYSSTQYLVWVAEYQNPDKRVLLKSDAPINSFGFSKDEKYAVIAAVDGSASVYRTADGEKLWQLHGHNAQVNSAYFSDDGRWVVTASDDKTVRFWDVSGLK